MNLHELDVVYFVKESEENEELRYSLRSVDRNFPHRNVVFVGGKPNGLNPDRHIYVDQNQETKWSNTSILLRTACLDPYISEEFVLFNDDFFILHTIINLPYYSDGPLSKRIYRLRLKHGKLTKYTARLLETKNMLEEKSFSTINYAVHYPIIINKKEMLETFEEFPQGLMWRSLYGNHHRKLTRLVEDCKIHNNTGAPSKHQLYVSTDDKSFRNGRVGEYIRTKFTSPCRYEIDTESL